MYFGAIRTVGGYTMDECSSAFQKSIRRSLVDDALFWGTEMELSGYGNYVWKRLRIIATEDIGPADPMVTVVVSTLYQNWQDFRKPKPNVGEVMFLVHAIIVAARAPKSRLVDHSLTVHCHGPRPHREVPDYALDKHTQRGRMKGRVHAEGFRHFFEEAATLLPTPTIDDPYAEDAKNLLIEWGRTGELRDYRKQDRPDGPFPHLPGADPASPPDRPENRRQPTLFNGDGVDDEPTGG